MALDGRLQLGGLCGHLLAQLLNLRRHILLRIAHGVPPRRRASRKSRTTSVCASVAAACALIAVVAFSTSVENATAFAFASSTRACWMSLFFVQSFTITYANARTQMPSTPNCTSWPATVVSTSGCCKGCTQRLPFLRRRCTPASESGGGKFNAHTGHGHTLPSGLGRSRKIFAQCSRESDPSMHFAVTAISGSMYA